MSTTVSTNLGALTTSFAPAVSCLADIWRYTDTESNYYYSIGPSSSSSACYPKSYINDPAAFYSPGVCPQGYTEATSTTVAAGTVTETQAKCCPSSYDVYTPLVFNFYGQACISSIASAGVITVTSSNAVAVQTAPVHVATTDGVGAFAVYIRYQSTDRTTSTATATSGSSSTPTSTSSGTSGATSTTATPASRLSSGAKAGIGAGVAVIVVGLLAVGIFYMLTRRKRHGESKAVSRNEKAELMGAEPKMAHELYTQPAELPS